MADYHPLIAKAVAGLEKNTGEARRALYGRARTALVTQLRSVVPALSESDITRERLALEEAIRKVEAESARQSRFDPPPRREAPATPSQERPDANAGATGGGHEQPHSSPSTTAADLRRPSRNQHSDDRTSLSDEGLKGFRDVVADAENLGEATVQAGKSAREAFAAVPAPSPEFERLEPRMEPKGLRSKERQSPPSREPVQRREPSGAHERSQPHEPVQRREAPRAREAAPRAPGSGLNFGRDEFSARDVEPISGRGPPSAEPVGPVGDTAAVPRRRRLFRPRAAAEVDHRPPSRSYRRLVMVAALVAVLAALGGVAYWQWQPIAGMVRTMLAKTPSIPAPRDASSSRQKIPDRIGSSDPATQSPGTAPGSQPSAIVAQRVVLYEEDPSDPLGKRYVGSSVWRTETVSPGPGQAPEIVIRADVEIPERKLTMKWSLRRNSDKALPASHTIEIMFTVPPDFPHQGIQNVPGILMKQAEQTRGVPLAGLAVKVTTGFFLIGLSALESDMQRNIQLLKERSWFDVPLVYNDGRRAILAVEKGNPGERVFNDAFTEWKQ